jgi:hypothetical protein
MQAQAAELPGYSGQPPPLFELRRVRKREKVAPQRSDGGFHCFLERKFKNSLFRVLSLKTGS